MHGIDLLQDLAVVLLVAGFVGWLCHKVGLSLIVGYLGAGMLIGPHTPPVSLVTDVHRIEILSQLGLVFLMFGIGLHLSLRRLKRLGLPLVVATVVNTVLIYYLTRLLGAAMHWNGTETLFVGAMLMISLSAIIGKILIEVGVTHEKVGQAAMSLTVMEDVVAVVMLTLLGSLAKFNGPDAGMMIGETIGLMGAFVVLAGILSLLFVPWLLRRLTSTGSVELQTLCMAGLMLGLAVIAARAGYSLALGAFMLGCVVAETMQKAQVERSFEGLHDVFSSVFFVAIGMQIDMRLLGEAGWLILAVTVFSLLLRPLTCAVGFVLAGTAPRDALRIGLVATPIGEFSLIIAQLGVNAMVIPPKFYPMAVGVSLLTSLVSPTLTRHSGEIADTLLARQPRWLESALAGYHAWLERMQLRGEQSQLWRLSRKRIIQIAVEVMLVSGLLLFSEQMFGLVRNYLPVDDSYPRGAVILFWGVLILISLMPLVAIWRNLSALAMIVADAATKGQASAARLRPLVETSIKAVFGVLIAIWLSAIVPLEGMGRWVPVVALVLAAVAVFLLRSRLVYWHSLMEVELQERLVQNDRKLTATTAPFLAEHGAWQLVLTECVIPDLAECRGRTLDELALRAKFGCVVAGIGRQGVMIGNPSPETALYPHDRVLLLGDRKQTAAVKRFLSTISGAPSITSIDEVHMESVTVPGESPLAGRSLADLALTRRLGIQVAGINRSGIRLLNPGGEEKLWSNDIVLVLGSPDQIKAFKATLQA